MEFRVLGTLRAIESGGSEVRLMSRAQRRLVSVLLVDARRTVPADRLADDLALSGGALRTSVSRLRRLLGDDVIVTDGPGYRVDADRFDVEIFEGLVAESVGDTAPARAAALGAALDLWRGEAYGEFAAEGWAQAEAQRLRELRSSAREALAAAQIELGDHAAALSGLAGLLAAEPYRDRPRELVMRALAADGRRVEALRVFQAYRRTLLDEVGTEPGDAIVRLERSIATAGTSGRTVNGTLPAPSSSFVGRLREVGVVTDLLTRHRLVTLTGAGGIGKSRVAVRAAEELLGRHPGGTWFVELVRVDGAAAVVEELASQVGAVAVGASAIELVSDRIAAVGPTLVVFDNAEHVVAGVADAVVRLLDRCRDLTILVTSREPLDVRGEHVWRLPPMTVPPPGSRPGPDDLAAFDATSLFLDRMGSARPDLTVDETDAALVAAICDRLDGLPLALELAAARTRTLHLRWILAGVETAMAVLDPESTSPDRHRSLRASIAWSVDLMEQGQRAALGRLSVFRSPFTAEAAAAVAGSAGAGTLEMLPVLVRLCDKSLIQFEGRTGRYHLLETIRHYCVTTLLDEDLWHETSARHAAWFARWCIEVGEGRHGIDRAPVLAEMPDVVAAMDWARRHAPERAMEMCVGLGSIRTTLGHHENLLATWSWLVGPDGPPHSPGWAGAVAALMAAATGARLEVEAVVPEVERHLGPADDRARGWLARGRAMVPAYHGDLQPVIDYSASVVARADDVEASVYLGFAAYMLALGGRMPEATAGVRHLRQVTRRHSTRFSVDTVGNGFAAHVLLTGAAGRLADALEFGHGPVPVDPAFSMTAAAALAHVALLAGDHEAMDRALCWGRRGTIPLLRFLATELELYRALAVADREAAASAAELFWAQATTVPVSRLSRCALVHLALLGDGRLDEARAVTSEAREMLGRMSGVPALQAAVHQVEARQAGVEGSADEQLRRATTMLELAERHGLAISVVDALESVASAAQRLGDQAGAERRLDVAHAARQRMGYRFSTNVLMRKEPIGAASSTAAVSGPAGKVQP